jgi:hypothetical protein
VTLQLQGGGAWQDVGPCLVKTPTGLIEIKPGTTNTEQVMAPGQPAGWIAGTYRVQLTYTLQRFGPSTVLYSGTFTIA